MLNVLFLIGFFFAVNFAFRIFDIPNAYHQAETNIEEISNIIILVLANFVRLFPLILSYGLQNLRSSRFNNGLHQNPNKIIMLSFLLFSVGMFLGMIDIDQLISFPPLKVAGFIGIYLAICLMEFLIIFSIPLLLEILTKDFNSECKKISNVESYKDVIDWYQELNKSLQLYCLCFYSHSQFMFIFNIYKNLYSIVNSLTLKIFLKLLGNIFLTISMILNVMNLTSALDSVYESVQSVKMKLQETLMVIYEKPERQQLKFLIEKIKSLTPMNACGYFEISKSTLTSMLSVRY